MKNFEASQPSRVWRKNINFLPNEIPNHSSISNKLGIPESMLKMKSNNMNHLNHSISKSRLFNSVQKKLEPLK